MPLPFHVKIDWPIADAAEDLAKWLRYIQNNLHENGTKRPAYSRISFLNIMFHYSVGGGGLRPDAAQLLKSLI